MKKLLLLIGIVASGTTLFAQSTTNFHDYSARDIHDDNVDFSDYHGKKVMVVNTASFCSFTPQFEDLQDLYDQYQQYDFEIIGFPCNDFDNQDPNNDSTILAFCTDTYGITFKMMSRIVAVEADTAPVFRWLQEEALNGVANAPVSWNFNKFLIDEAGNWVAHHSSFVNPTSSTITDWIMSASVLAGVDEASSIVSDVVLYPNPASDQVSIQFVLSETHAVRLSVIDLLGQTVATKELLFAAGAFTESIKVGGYASGLYLLRLETENSLRTQHFVVQ